MSTSSINRLTAALAGRYTVEREIGAGGMAAVYLAQDVRHSRPVAVKVMSADLQQSPERFLAEIRTAANLNHPHILPLYDSGEADGILFFTMPFVEGGITLETRLRAGALGLEESVRVAREIGAGLAHAHKHGLVHRDLKPANILFSSGHALLADFGIARAVERGATPGLTKTGHYVGSPQYMSPEQAFGNAEVDARADLYSLGCVLYEMLTGEPPYKGESALTVITAHAFAEVPLVSAKVPEVPDSVNYAVARAMAKQPDERFASVDEFLTAITADVDEAALTKLHRKPKRRVMARAAPWGMAAAAVITVAGVTYVALTRPEPPSSDVLLVENRVVIAPLRNETGDPSLEQVGRMASDLITEGLQRTGIVEVVPSATALQAAAFVSAAAATTDSILDPIAALAAETGAGKVITGSYYLLGDSLQFTMQVIDAVNGSVLDSSDPVKALRSNPGAAIEDLRDYVMSSLSLDLDPRFADVDFAQMVPPSYESYRAFDEGMQRYLASEWRPAAEAFRRAFAIDTTFVLALNYLTFSESNLRPNGGPVMDSLTQMLMARRSQLAEYHKHWLDYLIARGRGDNEEARAAIRQAALLAPGSKAVYNWAYTAQLTNRPQEAVDQLGTLDPERGAMRGWFPYWTLLTDNLHRLGEHEEELGAAIRAADLHPDVGWALRQVGEARAALGDLRELRELVADLDTREMRDVSPGDVWIAIADELRVHGHETEATEFYESALSWLDALPDSEKQARPARETRATALSSLRRFREARDIIAELREADPQDVGLVGWLGILDAWLENRGAATQALARMEQEDRTNTYARGSYALQAARIAAVLEDAQKATDLYLKAVAGGYRPLRHPDMNFDKIRDYPAFQAALQPKD